MSVKSESSVILKKQNLVIPDFNIAKEKVSKNKHYFLYLAILVALSYWVIDSAVHYFWYGELEFEIILSNSNELWMRIAIFILLVSFGFYADYTSRKIIATNKLIHLTDDIYRAKKQWELVVDSLPQLVIAMDDNARITRINRTIETWGIELVNKAIGLYVPDLLKCLNDDFADDGWTSDWPYIWQQIKNKDIIERKIEKEHSGNIYQYSLRRISDYDASKDQCYAVLIIDDITAREIVEKSLKEHAQALKEKVNYRTKELRHANSQLENELFAKKTANIKLKELQDSRLALLRDIFTTQEKERKRIACELHDSIGQSLGAAKFRIEEILIHKENFTDDNKQRKLNDLVKLIRNAILEVRHIAMDLRPAMLDDLGILATLKWFCREYENTYTSIKIDLSLHVDEHAISEQKKTVIFRIVQETMNNIAKHANATNVILELSESNYDLRLYINDNGHGFNTNLNKSNIDVNQPRCSFGLSSMRERAESTNGKFIIESTPGSGTSVIVSWENKDALSLDENLSVCNGG